MAVDLLLKTAKKYFENPAFGGKQIDEVFFPELDESTQTTVSVDRYTAAPFAARSIIQGAPANVRQYQPGDGVEYEPVATKEKTIIDEKLRDSVIAGISSMDSQAMHLQQAVRQIVDGPAGFRPAFKMSRSKAALDVMRTGVMQWLDDTGVVKQIDFERNAAISSGTLAYDFTATATFDSATKAIYDALRAQNQGFPSTGIGFLIGSSWLTEFETDTVVQAKRAASGYAQLINENILPPGYQGCEDMKFIGRYNVDGMAGPVNIFTYEPGYLYDNGVDTPSELFPATAAVMFPMMERNWRFNRGLDVNGPNESIVRSVGDLVLDSYTEKDPSAEWLRAQARFMYVPGNINRSASAVGTFV